MSVERATTRLPGHLAGLKRRGGGVLVVGTSGHGPLCRRFRGDASADRRVLALSPADCGCARDRLPASDAGPVVAEHSASRRLSAAGRDALDSIDRLAADGLEAGELRVCVGAGGLVGATDPERVSLFLEAILERTREANGLAHVHTTAPYRSDLVRSLEPLFDAVVEARGDPEPEQRWHVPGTPDTGWLPVRD